MRKIFTLFFCWLICLSAEANMASPVYPGSYSADVFTSRDVNILHEFLTIVPNADFSLAHFTAEYKIQSDRSGVAIPLVFYAIDYEKEFVVYLDGKQIELFPIEWATISNSDSLIAGLGEIGKLSRSNITGGDEVSLVFGEGGEVYTAGVHELKYFEIPLDSGQHTIRVEYDAIPWENRSGWIKEVDFRYSLSPAKYWKNFGGLTVTLDSRAVQYQITTNLGETKSGGMNELAVWEFESLPVDVILISLKPELSSLSKGLIWLDPFGMMIIFSLLIIALHMLLVRSHRNRKPAAKVSWVAIAGGVLFPLLMLWSYLWGMDIIDATIGEFASKRHGYAGLILFFYVVVMPVYLGLIIVYDFWLRNRRKRRNEGAIPPVSPH